MKKFWFYLAGVGVGVVGVPYYFWNQATQLPGWYDDRAISANAINLRDRAALQQAQQSTKTKFANVHPFADGTAAIELTESEFNSLLASEISSAVDTQNLASAVRAVNTTIKNGKIESGAVINLADASTETLTQNEQTLLMELVKVFPGLTDRDVYVGIEGTPTIENGQFSLRHTRIRIGNLRFSVADIAQQLGVSEAALRQELEHQIPLKQLGVHDVHVLGDRVQIRGVVN
ncbi:MAG: hypothetical protein HC866_16930 [Leptolyngbyaceae cyanobacterium RU_5_1]|nr:hypothetical protein [Leptolyngbyaceae cyanobacterium RU_5_1]